MHPIEPREYIPDMHSWASRALSTFVARLCFVVVSQVAETVQIDYRHEIRPCGCEEGAQLAVSHVEKSDKRN